VQEMVTWFLFYIGNDLSRESTVRMSLTLKKKA